MTNGMERSEHPMRPVDIISNGPAHNVTADHVQRHHVGMSEEDGVWWQRHHHNRYQSTCLRLLLLCDGDGLLGENGGY